MKFIVLCALIVAASAYEYKTEYGKFSGDHLKSVGDVSWTSPEGEAVKLTFVADEFGYKPEGSHVPKMPEQIARALEYIKSNPYVEKDYKVKKIAV